MSDYIRLRRGTSTQWTTANRILRLAEPGIETDTRRMKIGDGVTAWNALAYTAGGLAPEDIVNNLTTNSAQLVASAATVKQLKDITDTVGATAASAGAAASSAGATASSASTTASNAAAAAATASTAAAAAQATAAAKASLQTGALAASTSVAPNAQAVIDAIAVGSGTATPTPFSTSIPLTGYLTMGRTQVSAPITFTINTTGAVDRAETEIELIADGSSDVTFSGMTLVGAQGYDNTSGRVNFISVWRGAVGEYYYGVVLGVIKDLVKPYLLSATVENAAPSTIVLTFNEPLFGALAAASAFPVSGATVSSRAAGASAAVINLTLSAPTIAGAVHTVGYTKPGTDPLRDATGNETNSFSGIAVTNNIGTAASISVVTGTIVNEDMTAAGYLDYLFLGFEANTGLDRRKLNANFITGPTATGATRAQGTLGPATFSGTDGAPTATWSGDSYAKWNVAALSNTLAFTVPAGTGVKRAKVLVGFWDNSAGAGAQMTTTFALSGGGVAPSVQTLTTIDFSPIWREYVVTYNAGAQAQTLSITLAPVNRSFDCHMLVERVTYGT